MERTALLQLMLKRFALAPTAGQATVMRHLAAFLLSVKQQPLYLLRGYAGTGKTTLVSTLVQVLPEVGQKYVLLAPTGRAAKVLNQYTGKQASTIHRKLYQRTALADGSVRVVRKLNKHKKTVFIVDEASMISDSTADGGFGSRNSLLDDLMEFVFEGDACRLLLIGDKAQLPPVGLETSPALDFNGLMTAYSITAAQYELTEVMRQSLESGILFNATLLRERMQQQLYHFPLFKLHAFSDVVLVENERFEELLQDAFGGRDHTEAVIICRSNKRANNFNQEVRYRILGMEGELSAGDLLMVVKNNYFWMEEQEQGGFIANGDIAEIHRIHHTEELYGMRFADADISLVDYPDSPGLTVKLMLDTLLSDSSSLPEEAYQRFAAAVEEDYMDIASRRERFAKMKANPYYNALQVKFSYALTCHKTQGGQWPKVFVDAGFLHQKEEADHNDFRWLYTAFTRATSMLYLVNFPENAVENS
ncbi:MAG: AAA family ATPase [Bacteroidetes bacterium]|nr:AAA family ATPase [Bacteroidota bacterium]MBU1579810.1 AAA family ATPase [Bacteroidota bacterium]MBU2556348.1 AAA family ATPase [Bacteroidota bacterium]